MRPLLRPDTYSVEVDGGAYLMTAVGPVRLTGASIAGWIQRLTPFLDGRATLAELTASLPPPRAAMVEQVVLTLQEAGVVRDLDAADPANAPARELTEEVAREYRPELGYLGCFRDQPEAAFARYRDREALVVGDGPMVGPLAAAGLASGLRGLRVAAHPDELPGQVAAASRDDAQRVTYYPIEDPSELCRPACVAALLAGVGLVLHTTVAGQPTSVLERACAEAGVPLAQAVLADGEVWLVPVSDDGAPGWSAVGRRLAAMSGQRADRRDSAPHQAEPVALAVAGTRLVLGGHRALTRVTGPGRRDRLVRVAAHGYGGEEHRFLPHPFALPAGGTDPADLPGRVAALAGTPRMTEPELSRRAVRCLDSRLGLFRFAENRWEQTPLQVYEAVVADPVGWLPEGSPPRTVGVGFAEEAARCEAARWALARYASLMVDPRRLVEPGTHRPLATDPSADPRPGLAWGYEVDAPHRVRAVPAASAFPVLADPAPELPVGAGAGYDWDEAVTAGFASHARALATSALANATGPLVRVDLARAADLLPEPGERCRRLLTDHGGLPDCFDVTDLGGVFSGSGLPTFAFCRGGSTVAVVAAATAGTALAEGLRRVLLAVQGERDHGADYLPAAAPAIPEHLRGAALGPGQWQQVPPTPALVAARLRAAGVVAVAVPLDHDPGLTEILPHLVQVVLWEGDDDDC